MLAWFRTKICISNVNFTGKNQTKVEMTYYCLNPRPCNNQIKFQKPSITHKFKFLGQMVSNIESQLRFCKVSSLNLPVCNYWREQTKVHQVHNKKKGGIIARTKIRTRDFVKTKLRYYVRNHLIQKDKSLIIGDRWFLTLL